MSLSGNSSSQDDRAWSALIEASRALSRDIEAMRESLSGRQRSNQDGVHISTASLNRFKEAFCCHICVELYDTPYTLECGHTFCAVCMSSWFQRQKTCPQCRQVIVRRPTPAFAVRDQVKALRTLILKQDIQVNQNNRLQEGERLEQRLREMFPVTHRENYIHDTEDDVYRCGVCMFELDEDGLCARCNIPYSLNTATHHTRQSQQISSDTEEESDEDEGSLEGFVISDDDVSESGNNGSSSEDEMMETSSEENVTRGSNRNRPSVIELFSTSDESESESDSDNGNDEGASVTVSSSDDSMNNMIVLSSDDNEDSDKSESESGSSSSSSNNNISNIVQSSTENDTESDSSSDHHSNTINNINGIDQSEASSSNSSSSGENSTESEEDIDTDSSDDSESPRKRRRTYRN